LRTVIDSWEAADISVRSDENLLVPDIRIDINDEAHPHQNCEVHRGIFAMALRARMRLHKTLTFPNEIAAAQLQFSQVSLAFFAMPHLTAGNRVLRQERSPQNISVPDVIPAKAGIHREFKLGYRPSPE
jgi:hypothetical protein